MNRKARREYNKKLAEKLLDQWMVFTAMPDAGIYKVVGSKGPRVFLRRFDGGEEQAIPARVRILRLASPEEIAACVANKFAGKAEQGSGTEVWRVQSPSSIYWNADVVTPRHAGILKGIIS